MQVEAAGDYILDKLKNEIPKPLAYHNARHTIDVCEAAERIGKQEKNYCLRNEFAAYCRMVP